MEEVSIEKDHTNDVNIPSYKNIEVQTSFKKSLQSLKTINKIKVSLK